MITIVKADKQKSESLKKMAKITLERLNNTDMNKYPSNTLLDYYDIIHKLMESFSLSIGIKFKGEGAHQELIDYIAKEKKFSEQMRLLMQQIRDYRTRISYEGFMVQSNYIESNIHLINKIIESLLS